MMTFEPKKMSSPTLKFFPLFYSISVLLLLLLLLLLSRFSRVRLCATP